MSGITIEYIGYNNNFVKTVAMNRIYTNTNNVRMLKLLMLTIVKVYRFPSVRRPTSHSASLTDGNSIDR